MVVLEQSLLAHQQDAHHEIGQQVRNAIYRKDARQIQFGEEHRERRQHGSDEISSARENIEQAVGEEDHENGLQIPKVCVRQDVDFPERLRHRLLRQDRGDGRDDGDGDGAGNGQAAQLADQKGSHALAADRSQRVDRAGDGGEQRHADVVQQFGQDAKRVRVIQAEPVAGLGADDVVADEEQDGDGAYGFYCIRSVGGRHQGGHRRNPETAIDSPISGCSGPARVGAGAIVVHVNGRDGCGAVAGRWRGACGVAGGAAKAKVRRKGWVRWPGSSAYGDGCGRPTPRSTSKLAIRRVSRHIPAGLAAGVPLANRVRTGR